MVEVLEEVNLEEDLVALFVGIAAVLYHYRFQAAEVAIARTLLTCNKMKHEEMDVLCHHLAGSITIAWICMLQDSRD